MLLNFKMFAVIPVFPLVSADACDCGSQFIDSHHHIVRTARKVEQQERTDRKRMIERLEPLENPTSQSICDL